MPRSPLFAFLVLEEHPYGREMLRRLLEHGHVPQLVISERSAVADTERDKFHARIEGLLFNAPTIAESCAEHGVATTNVPKHTSPRVIAALEEHGLAPHGRCQFDGSTDSGSTDEKSADEGSADGGVTDEGRTAQEATAQEGTAEECTAEECTAEECTEERGRHERVTVGRTAGDRHRALDLIVLGGTRIIRGPLLDFPRDGVVNSHPGLLPDCRGSASPAWSVLHDIPVGATCHICNDGIDTGDVLLRRELDVLAGATYEDLCLGTLVLAGQLMAESLDAWRDGRFRGLRRGQGPSPWPTFKNAPDDVLAAVRRKLADGSYAPRRASELGPVRVPEARTLPGSSPEDRADNELRKG